MSAVYRCPTLCDPDCELNGWGCHEAHTEPERREHDPAGCEGRQLAASLTGILAAGHPVRLHHRAMLPHPALAPSCAEFGPVEGWGTMVFHGVGPGDVIAQAYEWAEEEGMIRMDKPDAAARAAGTEVTVRVRVVHRGTAFVELPGEELPARVPAAEVAEATGIDVSDLPAAELLVTLRETLDEGRVLSGWRRAG